MIDIDITQSINRMCEGKMDSAEQKVVGIVVKAMFINEGVEPEKDVNNRPMCPKCGKALNLKMKDGKHIHQYCKICGQHIKWEGEDAE